MKLSQFKFNLPEELIAKYPTVHRDEARLLVVHRKTGELEHRIFKDVLEYFKPKDFLFSTTPKFSLRGSLETKRKQEPKLKCSS